ncbi:MAG: DUF4362 domain-containing protein [Acidimicrobiales bacterium]
MSILRIRAVLLVLVAIAACGSGDPVTTDGGDGADISVSETERSFGANDNQCTSVRLKNEVEDEAVRAEALECFFGEYDAGTPVIVDLAIPTVEGDDLYHRYDYDGSSVLIVIDTRLDEFGSGGVSAQRCTAVEPGRFLPEGVECEDVDHAGFPEAD